MESERERHIEAAASDEGSYRALYLRQKLADDRYRFRPLQSSCARSIAISVASGELRSSEAEQREIPRPKHARPAHAHSPNAPRGLSSNGPRPFTSRLSSYHLAAPQSTIHGRCHLSLVTAAFPSGLRLLGHRCLSCRRRSRRGHRRQRPARPWISKSQTLLTGCGFFGAGCAETQRELAMRQARPRDAGSWSIFASPGFFTSSRSGSTCFHMLFPTAPSTGPIPLAALVTIQFHSRDGPCNAICAVWKASKEKKKKKRPDSLYSCS